MAQGRNGASGSQSKSDVTKELQGIQQASLEPFWANVLSWDWFTDVMDDRTECSKTSPELAMAHAEKLHGAMKDVPEEFDDVDSYVDAFEHLFFHEARMQIARCKSEVSAGEKVTFREAKTREKFQSKNFLAIELTRDPSVVKNIRYCTDDLVLLSTHQDPSVPAMHRLCFVENCAGTNLSLTWHVNMDSEVGQKVQDFAKTLKSPNQAWYVCTINSMATLHREYRALQGMRLKESFPLRGLILNSAQAQSEDEGIDKDPLDIPDKLATCLKEKYNDSQFKAMNQIFRKPFGVTLVQGPPGTGKTTTIMGIASALLHAKPKLTKVSRGEEERIAREAARESNLLSKRGKSLPPAEESAPMPRLFPKKNAKAAPKKSSAKKGAKKANKSVEGHDSSSGREIFRTQNYLHGSFKPWYDQDAGLVMQAPVDAANGTYQKRALRNELYDMSVKEVAKKIPQKVLICAPSNAAIDEICRRLTKDGILGPDGEKYKPPVVRLGPNVAPDLAEYGLNQIVDKKILARGQKHDNPSELKMKTLQESRIICCTLSVAGSRDLLEYPGGFDVVVIDEAAQAVEVSTLIPLQMGCKRLILIGDPLQLPATVFAQASQDKKYNRSLFERLQASQGATVLKTQYRMHPTISRFPSRTFYDSQLEDAENIMQLTGSHDQNPWWRMPCFHPTMFFDVRGCMYSHHKSWKNNAEVEFICSLIWWLRKFFPNEKFDDRIGVISPYQSQVRAIRKHLNKTIYHFDNSKDIPVKCATVDGFQGSEKDIIIVSTVRSGTTRGIGFVDDKRRMNVSLTRPRLNLWVVGDGEKLAFNSVQWKSFVAGCARDHSFMQVGQGKKTFSADGDPLMRTYLPLTLRKHFREHNDRWHPENELFDNIDDVTYDKEPRLESMGLPLQQFVLEDGAEFPKTTEEIDKEKKEKLERRKKEQAAKDKEASEMKAGGDTVRFLFFV